MQTKYVSLASKDYCFGGLPNISNIIRKPEPLGSKFKTTACPVTGCILHMKIQRGKEIMKDNQCNQEIGATAGCTLCMLEESHDVDLPHGLSGDSWFSSVRSEAAKDNEEVFQMKENKGLYPKDYIEMLQ